MTLVLRCRTPLGPRLEEMSYRWSRIIIMEYRSSNKTVCSAKYHIIWCLKYRARVLDGAVEARLKEIIVGVVFEVDGQGNRS